MPDLWIGSGSDPEPPPSVLRLRGEDGNEMVRLAIPCGYCGGYGATWWMWRHNGNMECWLDMDSVGTLTEQRDHEDAANWFATGLKRSISKLNGWGLVPCPDHWVPGAGDDRVATPVHGCAACEASMPPPGPFGARIQGLPGMVPSSIVLKGRWYAAPPKRPWWRRIGEYGA